GPEQLLLRRPAAPDALRHGREVALPDRPDADRGTGRAAAEVTADRHRSPGYGLSPRTENQRMRLSVSSSALSSSSKSSSSDFRANSLALPFSSATGLFISLSGMRFFAAA